ncbi:Superfamily II DNA or RNA helicase, SNF2 family [Geosmithia morbida]|uniref:Superfamily II DNA or RNA helicase, SNF2 family n=1 Tax=Geosmithia morbida TaxID=1094350 RepID=A0A9P5D9Q0_9HYPO|nr:Superfamily II DNA or RNA helicase, SNF2 family [Geosmithia morbida]KAF4126754.1 Superfamily II DNA or RNA helicase, SNF2 family [Geosmithia morbida]
MAANGHGLPRNNASSWNPAALLQPNHHQSPAAISIPSSPSSTTQAPPPTAQCQQQSQPMVFQFLDGNEASSSTGPPSGASTPAVSSDATPSGGVRPGNWVEKVHNVQARSEVPEPKRRRVYIDDGHHHKKIPVRANSGSVLGQYVLETHRETSGSMSLPASPTVDLTSGNDDDVIAIDDPLDEEVCYGLLKTHLNCTRVPSAKPGSQSLWGAGYWPAIKVVLRRQVDDKTNRIPVYDHTREIIGQLHASSAVALSPLLDSRINMRTECRLPPHPKRPGEEPGQPTSQSYPLDITVYGPVRSAKNVGGWLAKHNLRLISPTLVPKGIKVFNPHVSQFQPPPARVYPTQSHGSAVVSSSSMNRTVEEMKSEVMGVFDSLARSEDLPETEPDSRIITPLLKHQKQGLYFMQAREELQRDRPGQVALTSFWKIKMTPTHERRYYNVITQHAQREPPPETRGGILADMMGLGKTLSILSLVASSIEAARVWEGSEPSQPTAPETKPTRQDVLSSQATLHLTPLIRNSRATLLVCPLSTVTNWEEQIKQHVQDKALSYHIYHGSGRIKDPAKLAEFDLVITTYGSVSNELSSRSKGKEGLYPLEQLGWFRIVLDEAHMIREQATLQFKSIIRLQAQRRWAVTGTPVQNRLEDLASLLAFLRLHPFEHRSKFTRYIVEPFKAADTEVVPKLRILVDSITLRRLKDKIDLPPREDLVVKLDFNPDERGIYDLFAKNAEDRVKVLAGSNDGQALGGSTYIHILKSILRLRLLCAHGKDLLNDEDLASLQGMSAENAIDIDDDDESDKPVLSDKKAHEMFTLMQETNNDACIECSRKLGSGDTSMEQETQEDVLGYMTPCFHVICCSCINNYRSRAKALLDDGHSYGPCPVCRTHVRFEFVQLSRRDVDAEHDGPPKPHGKVPKKKFDGYSGPHTKTRALVQDLLKAKAESEAQGLDPPIKSVVFSAWTSHLDLIEMALKPAGITFTRLDGSMSRTARTAAMDRFREDRDIHVILVSIMAGGLGLNLTSGSHVYVMEPQYNPAAEAQAIDRVHRLGQKRPVRTVRYIMRGSFEEKMIELQDKKKKLASLSMDGQSKALDKAEAARNKLRDLRSLFK